MASDDSRAVAALSFPGSHTSYYLKATNFGFAIPTDAEILGIEVEVEHSASFGTAADSDVRIVKGGAIQATDATLISPWPGSDTYESYGSDSDLWGATWTPGDINGAGFGVALSVRAATGSGNASVDHIRITVHYDEPATLEAPEPYAATASWRWRRFYW